MLSFIRVTGPFIRLIVLFFFSLAACPVMGQALPKLVYRSMSDKGNWMAFTLSYEETADTLFVKSRNGNPVYGFAKATAGEFANEQYFTYRLPQQTVGLIDLASGLTQQYSGVSQFGFSKGGKYLLLLCKQSGESRLEIRNPSGNLITGIAGVQTFRLNPQGNTALCIIKKEGKNLIQLVNLSGSISQTTIAEHKETFTYTAWQNNGQSLAFVADAGATIWHYAIKGKLLSKLDAEQHPNFPNGHHIPKGSASKLMVSDDGKRVFFAIEQDNLSDKYQPEKVQIWHSDDAWIYPQRVAMHGFESVPKIVSWEPANNTFLPLSSLEKPMLMLCGKQQFSLSWNPYVNEPQYQRSAKMDLYLTDLHTGLTSLFLKKQYPDELHFSSSPYGRYLAYFRENQWWVYDLELKAHRLLTSTIPHPLFGPDYQNRDEPYGFAGWGINNSSILVYDAFDLWEIALTNGKATRISNGREAKLQHRIVHAHRQKLNFDGMESFSIDLKKGIVFEVATQSKAQTGFKRWSRKEGMETIIFGEYGYLNFSSSASGASYVFKQQRYGQPSSLWLGGERNAPQKLFEVPTPQGFISGGAEQIRYQNARNDSLYGALFYPVDFDPYKKYPMVVQIYQRLADRVNSPVNPSPYNMTGVNVANLTQKGYFVLMPDIVNQDGDPGLAATDCIVSAVKAVLKNGFINPEKIGLVGHSFGGYQTSFIITQTNLFATAISSGGINDLTSWYLSVCPSLKQPQYWRLENQQFRMRKNLYEDWEGYQRNSPIANVAKINTPLLLWTGENDQMVPATQAIEMHLALRRLGKKTTMLIYPEEDHVLMNKKNQVDLTVRVENWLDYYLKDEKHQWINEAIR